MTRERQRVQREYKRLIEKEQLRPAAKRYGFKTVSGFVYRMEDGWLFTVSLTATYEKLRVSLSVKPLVIDTLFWEIFGMLETAQRQPQSFHVKAAFVPYDLCLDTWSIPLTGTERAGEVLEQALSDSLSNILLFRETAFTLEDYRALEAQQPHPHRLNMLLCDIAAGRFSQAIAETEEELAAGHSGGFADEGGDIYDYILRYCRQQIEKGTTTC